MATQTLMTAEQFDQLPLEDGRRWELLDGELIEMASATPEHNHIAGKLNARLFVFLETHPFGVAIPDTEFATGADRRQQPDVAVLSLEAWRRLDRKRVPVIEMPLIAIEVVSPSESAIKLNRKIKAYIEAGVKEVWTIYPDTKQIYVFGSQTVRHYDAGQILETPLLPGFSLAVSDLLP